MPARNKLHAMSISQQEVDDLVSQAKKIKDDQNLIKTPRKGRRKSKLDIHENTILAMHNRGSSLSEIQIALKYLLNPIVDCDRSTISRFIKSQYLK